MTGYVVFWHLSDGTQDCVGLFKTLEAAQTHCCRRGNKCYVWDRHDSHGVAWLTRKGGLLGPNDGAPTFSIEAHEMRDEESQNSGGKLTQLRDRLDAIVKDGSLW